jgi:hypothetical protein
MWLRLRYFLAPPSYMPGCLSYCRMQSTFEEQDINIGYPPTVLLRYLFRITLMLKEGCALQPIVVCPGSHSLRRLSDPKLSCSAFAYSSSADLWTLWSLSLLRNSDPFLKRVSIFCRVFSAMSVCASGPMVVGSLLFAM